MAKRTTNKSGLIREYLKEHPEAGYSEIGKALSKHGVKTYDIANVFTAIKKQKEKEANGVTTTARRGRPPKNANASAKSSNAPTQAQSTKGSSDNAYDAALQFVSAAGGIDNATNILELIRKVVQSNLR